jgi:predicted CxxxxCH...CXXCH cytochrome family protein
MLAAGVLTCGLLPAAGCDDFASDEEPDAACEELALGCTECHGDPDRAVPAPPVDIRGRSDTAEVTVGAHQSHLGASDWHAEIPCRACHRVPAEVNAPGHIDGGPAELTWGELATTGDASPGFHRSAATCADVYCHGSTLGAGGSNTTPTWTVVDGSQAACGTCHALPPPAPHPQSPDCTTCHGAVVEAGGGFRDPSKHIDGQVEAAPLGCRSCHGNADNAAPPVDTEGRSDPSLVTVGAHQMHLEPSPWHRDVACEDCHRVPSTIGAAGHLDPAPAELRFGALASSGDATPAFDRAATTCEGLYCHGSTLMGPNAGGAVARTPEWTSVDGTWNACGSTCHTNPPGGTHPANDQCQICHGPVIELFDSVAPASSLWADERRHVDGRVDFGSTTCTVCHGDSDTGEPAPPLGTGGETQTSEPAVGAHQVHLARSGWHRPVACTDCHVLPGALPHTNGTVDFSWGGPSTADGAIPAYDDAARSCSGTYCHGTTLAGPNPGGSVDRTPVWTTVDGTYDQCGTTCHTNPPGAPHPTNDQCQLCHGAAISSFDSTDPAASTWSQPLLHINGEVD